MPRKPMQDIVPKSIRNIPLPETRQRVQEKKEVVREMRKEKPRQIEEKPEKVVLHYAPEEIVEPPKQTILRAKEEFEKEEVPVEEFTESVQREGPYSRKKMIIAIGSVVGVVFLAVVTSILFKGATLTFNPQVVNVPLKSEFTAKKNPGLGELPFQVVTLKQVGSEVVKATGEKQVDKRAAGTIVIYNNYNASSQRLIKNTRFATAEGLIFRINESVDVPGKKGNVPGSVEAVVTADEPGDKYNVGLKDFTVPGFKGDPRYTGFYARSKTPLAGGFSGIQKVVADPDRAKAKANIEAKITAELMKLAPEQVTADQILFNKAYRIDFVMLPEENGINSDVVIKEEGVLSMAVFDKSALSAVVAKTHITDYKNDPILITNLDKISFAPTADLKPASAETITFNLSGEAKFEWIYDELAIKQAVVGKRRSEIEESLKKFPMIGQVDISIRPFWFGKLPKTLDKITIKKIEK